MGKRLTNTLDIGEEKRRMNVLVLFSDYGFVTVAEILFGKQLSVINTAEWRVLRKLRHLPARGVRLRARRVYALPIYYCCSPWLLCSRGYRRAVAASVVLGL